MPDVKKNPLCMVEVETDLVKEIFRENGLSYEEECSVEDALSADLYEGGFQFFIMEDALEMFKFGMEFGDAARYRDSVIHFFAGDYRSWAVIIEDARRIREKVEAAVAKVVAARG